MTAVSPTRCVAPTTVIAASTGPAHGTYTTPNARPSTNPPALPLGWRVPMRANGRSSSVAKRRDEVAQPDHDQQDDAGVAQGVLRQMQEREDL